MLKINLHTARYTCVSRWFIALIGLLFFQSAQAQNEYRAFVDGHPGTFGPIEIRDASGKVLTYTGKNSEFEIRLPYPSFLIFGYIQNEKVFGHYADLREGLDTIIYGLGLDLIGTVEISAGSDNDFMEEIRPRELALNVGVGSNIENIIKTLGGVSSNNELSSQFSVRGGNFDENLIYVNDIEIYRPQLIQNGQQEGLSFINPAMVDRIKFSAGGFAAQYGDKMSSVLDVAYVRPDSTRIQTTLGTMLNSASIEGSHKKVSGIISFRHFTNSLLTSTLNTDGTYSMNFADIQSFVTWEINRHWSLDFLGNYARNAFQLRPESRTTEFGTIQAAYQLNVFMVGQENLNYEYQLGAFTLNYRPSLWAKYKWIGSITSINEEEYFDIQGAYNLSELDRDLGSSNLGKPVRTLGYGYYLDHGRNRMQSRILNFSHLGELGKKTSRTQVKYGIRYNREIVNDRYYEWLYMDSADYNVAPWSSSIDSIVLDDVVRANNQISRNRISSYVQAKQILDRQKNFWMVAGLRQSWESISQQWLWMPRVALFYEPHKNHNLRAPDSLKRTPSTYRLAIGAYHQAPFYREMRDFNGQLNRDLRAQESWHFVLGMDRIVTLWGKKFKYSTEAYYKQLSNLDPYLYDNIRIRYYANNASNGYAVGFDNRLYGQFNKGLESWFTLSLLQSKERIAYVDEAGVSRQSDWLRRPTDRRMNFAAIFQDRLPQNPSVRVNLTLNIGTAVPYYLNGDARYSSTPSLVPSYRRVDIGFSKVFRKNGDRATRAKWMKESWISLDVFNLLDINNVIAYSWVKDLNNARYGVPEYLTGRMLNLRWFAGF